MSIDVGKLTENPALSGSDGGRSITNIIYILYILGFFTGVTALVGVVLAYSSRETAQPPYRSHLDRQIKIFWRGLWFVIGIVVGWTLVSFIAAFTVGIGAVLYFFPIALGLWWFVWTVIAIVKGMQALGRQAAI